MPRPAFSAQFEWTESHKTHWPDQVMWAQPTAEGVFPSYIAAWHEVPPETGPSTAWYLREIGDLLIVISDTAATPPRSPASEAVADILRQMP